MEKGKGYGDHGDRETKDIIAWCRLGFKSDKNSVMETRKCVFVDFFVGGDYNFSYQ